MASHDWVFYMDSDSLITNPNITVESLLPASKQVDLVLTRDATGKRHRGEGLAHVK